MKLDWTCQPDKVSRVSKREAFLSTIHSHEDFWCCLMCFLVALSIYMLIVNIGKVLGFEASINNGL